MSDLDNFFAKSDRKKKYRRKAKIQTFTAKDFSADVHVNDTEKDNDIGVIAPDSAAAKILIEDSEEWNNYEEKDYSDLKIKQLDIAEEELKKSQDVDPADEIITPSNVWEKKEGRTVLDEDKNEDDDNNDDDDNDTTVIVKTDGEKDSSVEKETKISEEKEIKIDSKDEDGKPKGRYIPPHMRAAAAQGDKAPTLQPGRLPMASNIRRAVKIAPNIESEMEFPTLGAEPQPPSPKSKSPTMDQPGEMPHNQNKWNVADRTGSHNLRTVSPHENYSSTTNDNVVYNKISSNRENSHSPRFPRKMEGDNTGGDVSLQQLPTKQQEPSSPSNVIIRSSSDHHDENKDSSKSVITDNNSSTSISSSPAGPAKYIPPHMRNRNRFEALKR